jgi:hypothetical protein
MEIESPEFHPRYINTPLQSSSMRTKWNEIPEPVLFTYNNNNNEVALNSPNYSVLEYMNILDKRDVDALKRSNIGSMDKFIHVIVFLLKLKNPDYNISFHFGKNVYELSQILSEKLSEKKNISTAIVLFSFPDNSYVLELVYMSADGTLQCHNTNVTESTYAASLSCLDTFNKATYIGYVISQAE